MFFSLGSKIYFKSSPTTEDPGRPLWAWTPSLNAMHMGEKKKTKNSYLTPFFEASKALLLLGEVTGLNMAHLTSHMTGLPLVGFFKKQQQHRQSLPFILCLGTL